MFRNALKFKDTWAMPNSQLHKLLGEGKIKDAEACHKDTQRRERELLDRLPDPLKRAYDGPT